MVLSTHARHSRKSIEKQGKGLVRWLSSKSAYVQIFQHEFNPWSACKSKRKVPIPQLSSDPHMCTMVNILTHTPQKQ